MLRSDRCVNSRRNENLKSRLTKKPSTTGTSTVHCLTLEVGCEWALAVGSIQESFVSVCTESTGQHTNVPEDTLSRNHG